MLPEESFPNFSPSSPNFLSLDCSSLLNPAAAPGVATPTLGMDRSFVFASEQSEEHVRAGSGQRPCGEEDALPASVGD